MMAIFREMCEVDIFVLTDCLFSYSYFIVWLPHKGQIKIIDQHLPFIIE